MVEVIAYLRASSSFSPGERWEPLLSNAFDKVLGHQ